MKAQPGALLDQPAETAIAPASEVASVIERMAANPNVDVAKLDALISMQERLLSHQAKAEFDASFAEMQPELPEIDERGKLVVKGVVRSTYAKLEDIQKAIKPVLKQYGFAIRHRTEYPADKPNIIRIVGILSHRKGHSEESMFEAPADRSDFRSDIQSMGSTVSYGRRYTTLDLLNITTRGIDNDGGPQAPEPPDGFDAWWSVIQAEADSGLPALEEAWRKSKPEFKTHLANTDRSAWGQLKARAQKVGRK